MPLDGMAVWGTCSVTGGVMAARTHFARACQLGVLFQVPELAVHGDENLRGA